MLPVEVIAITNFVWPDVCESTCGHTALHGWCTIALTWRPAKFRGIPSSPEILKILVNPRWRLCRHLDLVQRLKLTGNISVASMRRPANLVEIREVVPEILKILVNPRWRLCRHLDLVQRLKLIGNISIGSMQRPAKFGKNQSISSGDIKYINKSKMAVVPPFWI